MGLGVAMGFLGHPPRHQMDDLSSLIMQALAGPGNIIASNVLDQA